MVYKSVLMALAVLGTAMCMNLEKIQKKNVLYFEASRDHFKNNQVTVEAVVCPDGNECPDGNTCCLLSSQEYGCCPLPDANCCSDHVHCCPNGYNCDVSAGTCTKGADVISWLTKVAAKRVEAVKCKDGSECPTGNTCCELSQGQYGCCPLEKATCCSDHVHCCPNGYTCDVSAGTCSKGADVVSWLTKVAAKRVEAVKCKDGSECPTGNTCCQLSQGQFGCCPLEKATCCSDHVHCCPNGYTCDVSAGTCSKGADVVSWLTKVAAKQVEAVKCDDGSECPTGNTCCEISAGQYGCCPLEKATCCSDHVHCCPNGYTCDVSAGTCSKGADVVSWLTKVAAKQVEAVKCDDGSECPTGNTCCEISAGQYGCCPLEKATCCSDHVHCCPNGYTCDVSAGTCSKGADVVSWLTKVATKRVEAVKCDDGSECPTGNTCCEISAGQYGCCPLEKATCCSDHVHCCPNGYTCDVSAGTCSKGADVVSWLTKVATKRVEAVKCDDGSECPTGNTCCEISAGQYGCCPLEKATCCSDHVHCCPNGYTCDVSAGTCSKGADVVSWLTKVATKRVEAVKCDDGSECPTGNTCCEISAGQYGCCPLEKATCCSDHVHCCPNGYTCDVSAGTCSKGADVVSWLTKVATKRVEAVKCDDGSECPTGNTCCEISAGQYGCCPLEKATCCSDHVHCCPNGYTCDVSAGTCSKGADVVSWLTKVATKRVEAVKCDDGSECPTGNTCCEISAGQYGCCPLEKATCCSDHVHCCPNGYTCDVSAGTCSKGADVVSWLTKVATKRVEAVKCDDGSECPTGNTCCEISAGQYGCCPLEKATCCSDHVHCCPNGYTCDVSAGTCSKGADVMSWLTKVAAKPAEKAVAHDAVVCPNGISSCPVNNSCCKTYPTGVYLCCPFIQAVCCTLHCCPEGYTCNETYGTCDKGSQALAWFRKQPSSPLV